MIMAGGSRRTSRRIATQTTPVKQQEDEAERELGIYERALMLVVMSELAATDETTRHLSYFMRPMREVAAEVGIGSTTLKRACREMGLAKWPYRRLRARRPSAGGEADRVLADKEDTHVRGARACEDAAKAPAEGVRHRRKGCREAPRGEAHLTLQEDAPPTVRVPQEGQGQGEKEGVEELGCINPWVAHGSMARLRS